jgi:hypothetical protein
MMQRLSALCVAAALVVMPLGPAWGDPDLDLLGEHFEAFTGIPPEAATPLTDEEKDGLRGRFFEVFFGVEFFGHAAVDGSLNAGLDVQVAFVDPATGTVQNGSLSFPNGAAGAGGNVGTIGPNGATVADVANPVTGDVFRIANVIDNSFGNGNTQAQVIQNNGPGANLSNIAIMNFAIIEVKESDLGAARSVLNTFFGAGGVQ